MMGMRAQTWMITLVLDISQSSVYITKVEFEGWYQIVWSVSAWIPVKGEYASRDINTDGINIKVDGEIIRQWLAWNVWMPQKIRELFFSSATCSYSAVWSSKFSVGIWYPCYSQVRGSTSAHQQHYSDHWSNTNLNSTQLSTSRQT
jgi:hypothetical protein